MLFRLLLLNITFFICSSAMASPPLLHLGDLLKESVRLPASEPVKDLRFSEEENLEDAMMIEPVSALPKHIEPANEKVEQVHFGKVEFSEARIKTDDEFNAMTEKLQKGFAQKRVDRDLEKNKALFKRATVKANQLASAKEVLNRAKKTNHNRAVATDKEGVSRGSEFIFYSMCKHIDSYEESNEIDLGTSICPGK